MNEQNGAACAARDAENLSGVVAAGLSAAGEGGAGAPPGVGAQPGAAPPPGGRVVDPAVVEKTCLQILRLVERGLGRSLYGHAHRATGGDKEFAASIVGSWAWSDAEMSEVASLIRATVEMYYLGQWVRPDLALLLALGTHAASYLAAVSSLKRRSAESSKLNQQAKDAQSQVPVDN